MTATEILRMALHFVWKADIQSACNLQNAGQDTAQNIQSYCSSDWSNGKFWPMAVCCSANVQSLTGIWRDAAWLVFGVICSIFMYILSKAFYHQLLDPNFGRQSGAGAAAASRFRMTTRNVAPYSQDPPFVPPYSSSNEENDTAAYGEADLPKYYGAPPYSPSEEKGGIAGGDVKIRENVTNPEEMSHERDLAAQVEHTNDYGRSDSEVTLPGRRGEGFV